MKTKSLFVCTDCGSSFSKWNGQCGQCQAWNTIIEEPYIANGKRTREHGYANERSLVTLAKDLVITHEKRMDCGLSELNRVLGGGLVHGSIVLIGGDPGIGKSTLLLQALDSVAA